MVITISPASASAQVSGTRQFSAAVSGLSNTAVSWSISPAVGSISSSGLYTAPNSISATQTVTVTATSVAAPSISASAAIILQPVVIAISPASATAQMSGTQQFSAAVTGSSNTAVTWSISPAVGNISSTGLYTAPNSISAAQTVTVTATSAANSSKAASATITLQPVAITISPAIATAQVSGTRQFSATVTGSSNTAVTWSISPVVGNISSTGLYTAPNSIGAAQTVTVTATSAADSSKAASATITLQPAAVTLSPASATAQVSGTQQFSATVTGSSNTAVTWSISPVVGNISSTGLYTAPNSISATQAVTVTATSAADSTKSGTATINLSPPVTLSVSPNLISITAGGQTQQFTATTAVSWSLNPAVGAITAAGLYTAPAFIGSPQTVTVTATSAADPSQSSSASVSLLSSGLAGYWPFDESSGSLAHDASGAGNNGTLLCKGGCSLPSWTAGSRQGALNFSSNNQSVSVPDSPSLDFSSQFTISFWLYKSAGASSLYYLTKGSAIAISTASPESEMHAALYNGGSQVARCAIAGVLDQTWQHFAITFDGSNIVFYVNGALNTTCSAAAAAGMPFSGAVSMGGLNPANPTGILDEVRIYSRALSAQEIAALYSDPGLSSSTGPPPPSISLSLSPSAASLPPAGTQQFTAAVTGSSNTAVSWSVAPGVGSISSTGLYTAPGSVSSAQTVTVTATSAANPSMSAPATVSLQPGVSVTLSPAIAAPALSGTQQFTASVTGSSNTAVSWAIAPAVGSISSTGLYTAPSSVSGSQTVTVTATSAADPSKSASATITLSSVQTLATFQLTEFFGVSWIDQPIEFRYDGGMPPLASTRMIGPNGAEIPYQWVSSCSDSSATKGCIAVHSPLPANASYTWTLQSGFPPSTTPANPVLLSQSGSSWQLSNGLTGVRIVSPAGNPSPWNLAPIQGILLPNGSWTAAGSAPNLLYSETSANGFEGDIGANLQTPMYTATAYSLSVIDSGPLKTVVKATYTFNRPLYFSGNTVLNPAGQGHYTLILTLYANSKSILLDEDSDMQFSYYLPLYSQLRPNIARYRGHDSLGPTGFDDPFCGYEAPVAVSAASNTSPIVISSPPAASLDNGQPLLISGVLGNSAANGSFFAKTSGYPAGQFALYLDSALTSPAAGNGPYAGGGSLEPAYRGQDLTPTPDAFIDLTYSSDRLASYICSASAYRKLLVNYPPAAHAAGWYSILYNSAAGSAAPAVGFYAGRSSRQSFSATGPSMPGIYSSNNHWISRTTDSGLQVDNLLRGPDACTTTLVHRNWAIWVSTQADLLAPASHQPIADDQNSLTGINLSRLYTYQLVFPDPPNGFTWQYLPSASMNTLIANVRNGTSLCGSVNCYYDLLSSSESSNWGRAILNMWQGNSSAAVQTALNSGLQLAQRISQTLASGDNHFDSPLGYYQLGLNTSPETAVLNAVLMDSNSTSAQKASAKATLALFGCLFWDNDWFPIDNNSGEGGGLSNQIQQYLQYRTQSAAVLPSQPYLASMLPTALTYPTNDFNAYFSPTGAAAGSTHYQSAFFEPLILNYLNFSLDGALSMNSPTWANYANWELSIQTPPEPRFGNFRKGYSNGDGNTEADVRTGMLGTALFSTNPSLAGNLMWAWKQSNSPSQLTEDDQFVTTLVAIDPTIPPVTPNLGSINIPGYHSAERHAFGTPNETSLWFINGGFYSSDGHRHCDDGQVSIYAHSAPLAIDFNANLYNPDTPGRFMHNSIVLDSELSHPWSNDQPSLFDACSLLQNPTNTEFAAFSHSTTSSATFTESDGTVWTRTVRTLDFDPAYPTIFVYDSFSGPSAPAGKTLTWNLMNTGAVSTPAGSIPAIPRFSAGCQSPAGALPSNGTVFGLANGLQHFNFTGAPWAAHPTGGINWDLYQIPSSGSAQFLIGNWGHGCQATREMDEYQKANGSPFAEIQDILRVHDTGPFTTLILPYRKTETPTRTVSQQACGVQIVQGAETSCFNNSAATYANASTSILTVYDASSKSAFGLSVTGGPQEVVVASGQIRWTIGGEQAGPRSLTLQGTWYPKPAVSVAGATYSYNYPGGAQTAPVTIVFSPTPWP